MVVDKQKVEREAREVLDKFAKALEKVEKIHEVEGWVDREEFERIEGNGNNSNAEFKDKMLANAPKHDDDFIIAETGGWK